jgi:dopamine beta-monooxygenase
MCRREEEVILNQNGADPTYEPAYCIPCRLHFSTCISVFFIDSIPNGDNVKDPSGTAWPGVGHNRAAGRGSLNQFGMDFRAEGSKWTKALCEKDSDCDGFSNGEELGDPSCIWIEGETPQIVTCSKAPNSGKIQCK